MKNTFTICFLLALMLFSSPPTIARELAQIGSGHAGDPNKPACGQNPYSRCETPKRGKKCDRHSPKCHPGDP